MRTNRERVYYYLEIIGVFLLLATISIRSLLNTGNIGHLWDWGIPYGSSALTQMYREGTNMWHPQYFGVPFSFAANITPFYLLFGFLGFLGLDGTFLTKAIIVVSLVVSGVSMFLLARTLLVITRPKSEQATTVSALISAYFYTTSPIFFNTMVSGANTQFITFAFAPAAFFCFAKAAISNSIRWVMGCAILITVISASFNMLFFVVILIPLFGFVLFGKRGFFTSLKTGILWLPMNAFWLIPFFMARSSIASFIATRAQVSQSLFNLQNETGGIIQSLLLANFWRGGLVENGLFEPNFFVNTIPRGLVWLWSLIAVFGFCVALVPLLSRPHKTYFFWWAVFLLGVIFDTGFHSPFPGLVQFTYQHFWFMSLFTDPQWLIWPTAISLSILLAYGTHHMLMPTSSVRTRNLFGM